MSTERSSTQLLNTNLQGLFHGPPFPPGQCIQRLFVYFNLTCRILPNPGSP
jgi:hypothetical protein